MRGKKEDKSEARKQTTKNYNQPKTLEYNYPVPEASI